jgi:NodT family efflux transporter outer membrane factor (OMF) lipoprotein
MKAVSAFGIIAVALLAGCATAPKYDVPAVPINEVYLNHTIQGTTPQTVQKSEWWKQFNDPLLNELVQAAQQQNITIEIASERIQAARAIHKAVASFRVPSINIGAGFSAFQLSENEPMIGPAFTMANPMTGGTGLLDRRSSSFLLGLNASWEADLFGRIKQRAKAAEIRTEQAEILREGVVILMTSEVICNYLQLRGAQNRLDLLSENIDLQRKLLARVQANVKNGLASELDLARATAQMTAVQAMKPQLETAKKAHIFRLATLLKEDISSMQKRLESHQNLPALHGIIPVGIPSDLLKRRPDIRIAERQMAVANAELGAAIADKYPQLILSGGPGLQAEHIGDLFSTGSDVYGVGIGVRWNLFDGGLRASMEKLAESEFKTAALSYEQCVRTAIEEVELMLVNYGNQQRLNDFVQQTDEKTQVALNKANVLYDAGLINASNVLEAQFQRNVVADADLLSRLQTVNSVVALYKALGGNWNEKTL